MARTPRNQNSKSPATTNVGEMFVAIASHEIEATPSEVNAADLFQQAKIRAYNQGIRRNRANKEYPYQKGNVLVQYSWDGTPDSIFLTGEAMSDYTKGLIFNPCSDLKVIPRFLYNFTGHDLRWASYNRETNEIQKVKQTTFQIG